MPDLTHDPALERYIVEHLDEAIEKGWIKPYFQPVIRTVSRQLCGMEALARWEDPEWGLLPPACFIGVLEKHRRIHELDACIVRQVCALYREAVLGRGALIPVSVNLSRLDYELCDIFAVVEEAVQAHLMPRNFLCIEITESALNQNGELMHRCIDRFRGAGYQVWMDDFGSGYSSLNVLKDFAFDELKVDMYFLSDFHQRSRRILSSIVHMAKEIDIQTLVEGVETEEQFQFLRNIGFEKVQGYLFGKPMPYLDCIRHVLEQGLSVEAPMHRGYYDELGRLDVLSATPFLSPADRKNLISGRELNSIPLAVVEKQADSMLMLLTNDAFDAAAAAIDWCAVFGNLAPDPLARDARRMTEVPRHLLRLLEEARLAGESRMNFVDGGEYYEIRAKRVAAHGDRCSLLLRMDNLSRGAELERQQELDEGLRRLYSVYDRVSLLDLDKGSFTSLFSDSGEDENREENLRSFIQRYAGERIYPEDRQHFLLLMDPDTLADRVSAAQRGFIGAHLRTRQHHGRYLWMLHTVVHSHGPCYFLLQRDAEEEVMEFMALSSRTEADDGPFSCRALWQNFTLNSPLKFFWKDRDRRFVGASRSFLDFYGFRSLNDILGKNDEEMGWHLHPDDYKSDEWDVIRDGVSTRNVPGSCLIAGENRRIFASKMPLFDRDGTIHGLLGYFFQQDDMAEVVSGNGSARARTDTLTGLLNARGLSEELFSYRDEYELRRIDFARIHISVRDFSAVNEKFGYDFGDSVIRDVAAALVSCCGVTASVGRLNGSHFVVLAQFRAYGEVEALVNRIRAIPEGIHAVDGVPFSLYLAVGWSLFSDCDDVGVMADKAETRMLADHRGTDAAHIPESMARVFRSYDALPIASAVYLFQGPGGSTDSAAILYANERMLALTGRSREQLVGRSIQELYPVRDARWNELAARAAWEGRSGSGWAYYPLLGKVLWCTCSQVIGKGYCLFTYQPELETPVPEELRSDDRREQDA